MWMTVAQRVRKMKSVPRGRWRLSMLEGVSRRSMMKGLSMMMRKIERRPQGSAREYG